jgi:hypothetical protein
MVASKSTPESASFDASMLMRTRGQHFEKDGGQEPSQRGESKDRTALKIGFREHRLGGHGVHRAGRNPVDEREQKWRSLPKKQVAHRGTGRYQIFTIN